MLSKGSSLFGGQFQSSVKEATCSQEKLSQVRRLASLGSRVAQGTSGSRAAQQSQKRRAIPPPHPPPTAQSVSSGDGGSAAKRCRSKNGQQQKVWWGPAQSQAQQCARGQGVSNKRPQLVAVDGFTPSLPPIPPILGEGVEGSTFLDIPGLVWDTQLGTAQKGLFLWVAGCRFSCQPGNG